MGKLTDSLISGTTGRIGRVVVANVFGTEIIKIRPKKSSKPPSEKQNLIKDRFNKAVFFLSSYKEFAKIHFAERRGMVSRYNFALSAIINAIKCDMDTMQLVTQYEKIIFSRGNALRPFPVGLSASTPLKIEITWENNAVNDFQDEDNLLILLAIDGDLEEETLFYETSAQRQDLSYELTLLPRYQNKTMHIWIAFFDNEKQMASNSAYLGTVLVT